MRKKNNYTAILASFVKRHIFLIICFTIVLIAISYWAMSTPPHRWGDASTYYMQITSIADDHDLEYQPLDISRALENKFDDLPAGLFLIKTDDGRYFYGKEFTYALFAAPFYKVFGNRGILLFNGLMFFGLILMGYLFLRRYNNGILSFSVSISYFILSIAFVYIFWIHVEIYNMFLIMLTLFIWTAYLKNHAMKYLVIASLLIGLAVVAKAPNIVFFLPVVSYELYKKRLSNFAIMLASIATPIIIIYGYFYLNTGIISFYGGDRYIYLDQYPFVNGYNATNEAGNIYFSLYSNTDVLINKSNPIIIPYNIFYYLVGRFTGLLWYYPFAIYALLFGTYLMVTRFARKSSCTDLNDTDFDTRMCILAGATLFIITFTSVIGNNYLGGQHAVGNRYFYIYPALIFLFGKIDIKTLLVFFAIALIFLIPIIINPIDHSTSPEIHAYNIRYTYLPLEYSQIDNLPIWMNKYNISGYDVYSMDNHFLSMPKNDTVYCFNSDFYLRSYNKIMTMNTTITSLADNNNVDFTYAGQEYRFKVNSTRPEILEITDPAPDYYDGRYYIYKVSSSSDREILVNF